MSQTFVFEELDHATRDYLLAVRDSQGEGAPGIFAPVTSLMAAGGCVCGVAGSGGHDRSAGLLALPAGLIIAARAWRRARSRRAAVSRR